MSPLMLDLYLNSCTSRHF